MSGPWLRGRMKKAAAIFGVDLVKMSDFDTEIRKHLRDGPLETTHGDHIPFAAPYSTGQALYRSPINPSLDGNTVELAVEQLQFSENATRYQTTLNFLDGRIKGLMSAIRGE